MSFTLQSDIASMLESFCSVSGLLPNQAINDLIRPRLEQICQDGDSALLLSHLQGYEYDDQNEALALIERYKTFCPEHNTGAYDPELRLRRVPNGNWELVSCSTHLDDESAIFQ